jgi:hypothetical protein
VRVKRLPFRRHQRHLLCRALRLKRELGFEGCFHYFFTKIL